MKVPVTSFYIESDYREQVDGLADLVLSIQSTGLINPITAVWDEEKRAYRIDAGRRRFRALTEFMGVTELEENVHFRIFSSDVDPLIIQLSENANREDFKPIETARLVRDIHQKMMGLHGKAFKGEVGGWGQKQTAELVGKDISFINRMLSIASNEELVKDCTTVQEALKRISDAKSTKILTSINAKKVEKFIKENATGEKNDGAAFLTNFKCMGAEAFLPTVASESVDFVHCDSPYGIDLDKVAGGELYSSYSDRPEDYEKLIPFCMAEYYRILKQNKYIVSWCDFSYFPYVCEEMKKVGFSVGLVPIVWVKMNTSGRTSNPNKCIASAVEIAAYGWKGNFATLSMPGRHNIFPFNTVKTNRIHVAQKPDELIEAVLEVFSAEGDVVIDTFSGSGSTLRACYKTKRFFSGCELSEENYNGSIALFKDMLSGEKKEGVE